MDNRYVIAEQNGMSREFADWFFDNKKADCGDVWFMMMAAMWEGWKGRAAMLQCSEQPQNVQQNIPEIIPATQFKPVADLYALCWQPGDVVTYTPEPEKAAIWLNNYSGTCVKEYVKLERLQNALTGNSPVTPDGSPNMMLQRWLAFGRAMQSSGSQLPRHLIAETESMLAAPQQEVTLALAKGMKRYGDAMQELAKKEVK